MKISRFLVVGVFGFAIFGCASVDKVDLTEPKRVLGSENNVRVDAQIFAEKISPNALVRVTYEIENQRPNPIAIADIVPEVDYDGETRMITVSLGSEVPGNELLPRLIKITPGERKAFTTGARMNLFLPGSGPLLATPRYLQLKVNFLGETQPFQKLIDISEKAIFDPKLADSLFPTWVENNEAVTTNAIPIQWSGQTADSGVSAETSGTGRGRVTRRPPRPPGSPF